ncbi:electron transfer flavoprotein alpha subunit apoprotein [Paraburkholderia sp. BL18I3N2]|nr:electron transfer flavoprotein alpha subunit apoprotein [Paraburkholderia sp. BL18I3N2]
MVPVEVIDKPSWWVLVVPDLEGGRLSSHDRDVLGAARLLADAGLDGGPGKGAVIALVHGVCSDELAESGVDRVQLFESPSQEYIPELRTAAVLATIQAFQPRHVLWPDIATAGGDVGRRVAAALRLRPAARVVRLTAREAASRIQGGSKDLLRAPPQLMFIVAEAAEPFRGSRHEARQLPALALATQQGSIVDCGVVAADPQRLPLTEADLIVSAGNGVTDWPAFHALCHALGGTPGGSRAVCDAGHLPRARQVGASGSLVEPRCYLAFGISGAPQHLAGIARCERVIAVNTDLHADMVKRADLSIIADAQVVMPALTRLMEGVSRVADNEESCHAD